MNVGSSTSGYAAAVPQLQDRQGAGEVRGERENDGDRDDGASAVKASPVSTVNMNGQQIGQLINVSA